MSQLRFRLDRLHAAFLCAVVALASSGALTYLVAHDLSLQPVSATGTAGSTPAGAAAPGQSPPGAGVSPAAGGAGSAGTAGHYQYGTNLGQGAGLGPQGGVLNIGAVITQSGLGDETAVYRGLDAAIQAADAAGGVHGVRLGLHVLDDGTDPGRGQADLNELVEQEHVFALVGECAPLTDYDAGPFFQSQQVPVFGPCFTQNADYKNPYVFPVLLRPYLSGQLMAKFLIHQMGSHAPAIVSLDVNVLDNSYDGAIAQFKAEGVTPCDAEKVNEAQTAYDSVVLNEIQNHCDGVILNLDPARTIDWLSAAQRYSYKPLMVGLTAFDQSVVQNGGPEAEGLVTYFAQYMPSVDGSLPAMSTFISEMHRFHPEENNLNLALVGYMAGWGFIHELSGISGAITRAAFVQQLYSGPLDPGVELAGRWTPSDHDFINETRFYVLHQGRWQSDSGWYGLQS